MKINEVEKKTCMTKKAIRFYEEQDLIHPARAENGYREYSEADVRELMEIGFLRRLLIPVDDIRKLREGEMTLDECMYSHVHKLTEKQNTVEKAKQLCQNIAQTEQSLSELDIEKYEDCFAELEKGGFRVSGIEDYGKKRMKSAGIAAGIFIAFMLVIEGIIIYAQIAGSMPLGIFVFVSAVILFPVGGTIWALNERRKELKKGEAYEAVKY